MAFVSAKDRRGREQKSVAYQDVPDPDFAEVFDASLGQVIDEGLSISGILNREGWSQREEQAKQLLDEGNIDRASYMSHTARGYLFDYNRLAEDYPEQIKTDVQLEIERSDMLARRRAYSNDIIERGSGWAQFWGGFTGYMTDPFNLATLPISTAATTTKSLGVVGTMLMTARNTAALNVATEAVIQPFVYQHKRSINSPYSVEEAIAALGMAGAAGGALGGIGGLGSYLSKVRDAAKVERALLAAGGATAEAQKGAALRNTLNRTVNEDGTPVVPFAPQPSVIDRGFSFEQVDSSINYLTRMIDTLKQAPRVDLEQMRLNYIDDAKARILEDVTLEPTRADIKANAAELSQLKGMTRALVANIEPLVKRFKELDFPGREAEFSKLTEGLNKLRDDLKKPPKKAKGETTEAFNTRTQKEDIAFRAQLEELTKQLNTPRNVKRFGLAETTDQWNMLMDRMRRTLDQRDMFSRANTARSHLNKLDKGEVPDHLVGELDRRVNEAQVENDVNFLRQLESVKMRSNPPPRKPEHFEPLAPTAPPAPRTSGSLQEWALDEQGTKEAFNRSMQEYLELDAPKIVADDGSLVSADTVIKELDDEIEGLESIMVCVRG